MAEKPILFSGPMVRAILDGRKTQTRRVIKHRENRWEVDDADGYNWPYWPCYVYGEPEPVVMKCPYGEPGDNLWVRERQRVAELVLCAGRVNEIRVDYEADGTSSALIPYPERLKGNPRCGFCLSYGGYRESSRINLTVKAVRVERVQDISEEDARKEGAEFATPGQLTGQQGCRYGFQLLWDSINEKRGFGWSTNPWVWVVEFEHAQDRGDSSLRGFAKKHGMDFGAATDQQEQLDLETGKRFGNA